jgi:zinc protease
MAIGFLVLAAAGLAGRATAAPGVPAVRTLPNGLVAVTLEDHTVPLVSASLWVRSGSRDEIETSAGYAHFLEHLIQRGAGGGAPFESQRRAHRWGGSLSVRASYDRTHLTITGVPGALRDMLDTLAAMAFRADLKDAEIDKELGALTQEVRNYYDDPSTVAFLETMRATFPDHPYRVPPLGNFRTIGNLKSPALSAFYRNLYVPNNMALAVAGDIDPARVAVWVDELYGKAKRSATLPPRPPAPAAFPGHSDIEKKLDLKETRISLAFSGPGYRHPDRPAFEVLGRCLGDAGGSPIATALVAAGLSAGTQVVAYGLEDAALLYVGLTAPTPLQAYDTATMALEEIVALKRRGFTADETRRCTDRILHEDRLRAEQVFERAQALGEAALFGGVRYYWDLPVAYGSLTPADLARVAAAWLVPDNLRLVILMPKDSADFTEEVKQKFHAALDRLNPPPGARPPQPPQPVPRFAATAYTSETAGRPTADAWGDPRGAAGRPTPRRLVLDNGLTVIVQEDRRHRLAAAVLVLGAGSGDDPSGREGLASIAANAVTATHAVAARARAASRPRPGVVEAAPSPDLAVSRSQTEFRILGDAARVQSGLRGLAGLIKDPRIEDQVLESMRARSLAFLERSERDAIFVGQELVREKAYAGHPYAHAGVGTPAGINAVRAGDVAGFVARHYRPERAVLTIAGDLEAEPTLALARELFADWNRGASTSAGTTAAPPARAPRGGAFTRTLAAASSLAILGVPGPPAGDPDFAHLRLLGTAATLAAFEDMVFARRAAFSVTALPEAHPGGGALMLSVVAPHARRDEAVFDLQRMLRRIVNEGVPEADIPDLLNIQAGQDAAAAAGVLGQANTLAWNERGDAGSAPATIAPGSLKETAGRYLAPESWITVKVGPSGD